MLPSQPFPLPLIRYQRMAPGSARRMKEDLDRTRGGGGFGGSGDKAAGDADRGRDGDKAAGGTRFHEVQHLGFGPLASYEFATSLRQY